MDSADILKHFLKGIQKDDSPSKVNLANLKKWESELKKISYIAHPEILMKCVIKFIDFVVNYATTQSPQCQHSVCKDSFGTLKEIITPELKNIFVKQVTKRIFDIIIEENADSWCMKRELLKVFNHCIESSDKMVRNKTVEEFSDMYIYKMVDSISSYGDYDLQVQLIETVFRMYGQITINNRLKDLIPESQELSQSFAEIRDETFDEDIRTFLNNLNKTSGKLFSIVCESIKVGEVVCLPVTSSVDGLWVDFNLWEATITWYCSSNSFHEEENNEEDEVVWNLVTIFASDIESVNIHSSADNSSYIIYCKLSGSCLSSGDYQDILNKANNLSILVESSKLANTLITEVLPRLFGKKIQQASQKDVRRKVSTKSDYKALNIKFKRRAKSVSSRCKSDISCTTSLFDPTSARSTTTKSEESALSKNQSMDQTRPSISSQSSNIEVITIDSSAEQRNRGSRLLSVIPEQDEIVPDNECIKDAISVNSSETGKLSNLSEAPHIQIFSGRCSGSNMVYSRASRDRVCSTPIKVSTYDINRIETVRESNKVSQAEIYETAQEYLQSQNVTKVGRTNITDSPSEDYDSQKTRKIESYNDYKSCQSVDETCLKTFREAESNNIIENHETGIPTTPNWIATSAKFHFNSNLLSECLLKKYSFNFPEMTEDYDSMKVNISTDKRRPVNLKVSTAVMQGIENISPSSTNSRNMECSNQKPAESKKIKHNQAGNNLSLDFEDKLILTSEAIEVPLKKVSRAIDSSHKKVSTKIVEVMNDERFTDESYFNSLEVNIFEDSVKPRKQNYSDKVTPATTSRTGSKVDIINQSNKIFKETKNDIGKKDEKRKSTKKIQDSKDISASEVSKHASDSEIRQSKLDEILQRNKEASSKNRKIHQDRSRTKTKREIYKEKKKIVEEDEKKSTENIQAGKQTSPPKASTSKMHEDANRTKTKRDNYKEEKKTFEEYEKKSTENTQADKQTSPPKVSTSKVHEDTSRTKTNRDNYKEKKKTVEEYENKSTENIQADKHTSPSKVSTSKVHEDTSRTKTKRDIYKEKKKAIEENEKKSTEEIQADKQTLPREVYKIASNNELKQSKSDEIFQNKKKLIIRKESDSQASSGDSKIHQDVSKTAKGEMKRNVLTSSKKSEDKTEKVSNHSISIALKLDKENVSPSDIRQLKKTSVVDSKHHGTSGCNKGTLKREHEPQNEIISMEIDPPNDKLKSNIMNVVETRKQVESYKNKIEHVEHPKEEKGDPRKGMVNIFSKTGISTEESDKQNQDICRSSKSPDLFDIELSKKHNEGTQKLLEKVLRGDVETSAGNEIIKTDVPSGNVEIDKHSGSKTSVDSIEKISTSQTLGRSNSNKDELKTIVDVEANSKKQVSDQIDLYKDVLEELKFSNIEDIVSDMNSEKHDQFVDQKDLYKNKVENSEKVTEIHDQKSITNSNEQDEVSKVTGQSFKEKLPITTLKEKRKRSWLGKNPKKKQTKSTLKKGIRKLSPESSEDDDIALSEVRKKLLKKKIPNQEFSSLRKVDKKSTSVTVSKTGIMSDLKVSGENGEVGYENIMKNNEKPPFDDKLNKADAAFLNDQIDNVDLYVPLEDQVNKISSTGGKVTDKSAASEDSCSDNELIPDLATPVVRIDPDKAFENLLKTSSLTNHATVKKVKVSLNRITSSSSGEVIYIKTSSQETDMKLKSTTQEECHEDIQKNFKHPDSPIKISDTLKSIDNIDTNVVLTDKIISSESKVRELKSTLKFPKYTIDPSYIKNKEVIKEISMNKGTVEKDSPALLEKNKKYVKFDSVAPAKKHEEIAEFSPNETKDPNQTLSTTLSGRRRRKLYNPDDLSYLNSVTDPVSPTSFNDITENFNKTDKVKELIFLNRSSNVSVNSKNAEIPDALVQKESDNPVKKGVGKFFLGQSSVCPKESIERDSTAVLPGIVPLKKRTEMPTFGINPPKKEAITRKPRKSISKNEISYRDIKKHQNEDNKKRLKTVNLNTSIVNSNGKSHLKSFFENMLDSFREEMGGESLLEKLNKNKVKDEKSEKKSKRPTYRLSDTGDKKLREKRKSEQKAKISSEQSKKRRETFHSTSLKPKSVKTNHARRTTGNVSSSSPSLNIPKRFSHPVQKTPRKYTPMDSQLPEENNNLPSDFKLDRNIRKRLKPFEETSSVQKEEEDNQTDEASAAKSHTKITILSDIRIRPGWDEVPSSPKKIKMFEGPHLDNETIRENFSQERDLDNADNTQSTQISACPMLVSKHAPSWQGAALLDDKIVTLKSTDYLKKYLVLFFYPIDFGTLPYVCDPMEIISFNSRIEDFRRINVEIVACSVDSFFTHNVWVKNLKQEGLLDKLDVPLLSDANHHISKAYKIYSDHLGHTFRGVFIIDPNGIIIQEIKVDLLSRIDVDIFFNWLKSIQSTI